jgi:hypothetical protein
LLTLYESFAISWTPHPPKSPGTSPDPESVEVNQYNRNLIRI